MKFIFSLKKRFHFFAVLTHEKFFPLEDKLHMFVPPCNILFVFSSVQFIDLFGHNTSIYIKYLKIIKEKMARKPLKKPGGL